MNKIQLIKHIIAQLEDVYRNAVAAANRAHSSATDKENIAENKYDTLGLEAAYLAEGQARRVLECEVELNEFKRLLLVDDACHDEVKVGSFIHLEDDHGQGGYLFLGASAGGLKVSFENKLIMIITPESPLGKALLGLSVDDEVQLLVAGEKVNYCIVDTY